jgi:hypothetical protein
MIHAGTRRSHRALMDTLHHSLVVSFGNLDTEIAFHLRKADPRFLRHATAYVLKLEPAKPNDVPANVNSNRLALLVARVLLVSFT